METITIQVLDIATNTLVDKVLEVVRTPRPTGAYEEHWYETDTQYIQEWLPIETQQDRLDDLEDAIVELAELIGE